MTYKEIKELLKMVEESDLAEFKLKDGDFEISIRTGSYSKVKMTSQPILATPAMAAQPQAPVPMANMAAASPASAPADAADGTEGLLEVRSPIVGTFYRLSLIHI